MKVVAIDTSPEREKGAISKRLDPFLDGMRESGADVELYYSRDLLIFPCCGNLNCTVRTPGHCMAYDDMRWLRHKIGQADVLVLASPLFINGHTGEAGITDAMKRLEDRLALCQGLDDRPYEHSVHTTREAVNLRKVVIVSGCGFLEIDGFYPVLTHLKAFCYNSFPELAGCITGAHRVKSRYFSPYASAVDIVRTARAAGRGLVEDFPRLPMSVKSAPACDVGKKGLVTRREWEAVTLFEFSVIH